MPAVTRDHHEGRYNTAMPPEAVVGFWSYARDDDRLDGGAVLKLASLLVDEYELLSGESLELFRDQTSISWGDKWRERIDAALSQTTFLIPIVTPRYFTRAECRRELLEFAGKAKSLGVEELLLPILYVDVEGFGTDSQDEAVALVAATQYQDWRHNRLLDPQSREYRTAVNALARRLLEIAKDVAQKQFAREVSADSESEDTQGMVEVIEAITSILPEWLDVVQGEQINDAHMDVTIHRLLRPVYKLKESHAPASAVLAAQTRFAREMLPLAERAQKDARIYLARSIQLDPLMTALARLVAQHPDSVELVEPIKQAIDQAITVINKAEQAKAEPGYHTIASHFEEMKHLGRIFQKCFAIFIDAGRASREGNEIVKRWDAELGTATVASGPAETS